MHDFYTDLRSIPAAGPLADASVLPSLVWAGPPDYSAAPPKLPRARFALERERSPDRADRADHADRTDRADRVDRTDRADRVDRTDRADRVDRTDRADRADHADRTDRVGWLYTPFRGDRVYISAGSPTVGSAFRRLLSVPREDNVCSP